MPVSKRTFHKYVFKLEVLSEEELPEDLELSELAQAVEFGECSGRRLDTEHEELDGPTTAKALIEQGSDPEFFDLTEDGEDASPEPLSVDDALELEDDEEYDYGTDPVADSTEMEDY